MKKMEDIQVEPERIRLTHRETGEEKEFLLRPFVAKDVEGVMACVRSEYGDSYFKPFFYDKEKILEKAFSDHYDFFVAETDGEIAGFEIFTYPDAPDEFVEAASQILNRRYRGYGMSGVMVDYIFSVLERLEPASIFVHAVTFHTSTQITYVKRGMTPTGYRLGRFLTKMMENSYKKGRCDKYSEGILIKPVAKRDAGTVYLPEEVTDFGTRVYRELGVRYEVRTCPAGSEETLGQDTWSALPETGEYRVTVDEIQQFVEVYVIREGRDLSRQVAEQVESCLGKGFYTVQVILPVDTAAVFVYYKELKAAGLFFTGMRPLCGPREQMYMQWVDDWNLCTEDYDLTEQFRKVEREIDAFYRRRER